MYVFPCWLSFYGGTFSLVAVCGIFETEEWNLWSPLSRIAETAECEWILKKAWFGHDVMPKSMLKLDSCTYLLESSPYNTVWLWPLSSLAVLWVLQVFISAESEEDCGQRVIVAVNIRCWHVLYRCIYNIHIYPHVYVWSWRSSSAPPHRLTFCFRAGELSPHHRLDLKSNASIWLGTCSRNMFCIFLLQFLKELVLLVYWDMFFPLFWGTIVKALFNIGAFHFCLLGISLRRYVWGCRWKNSYSLK